MPTPGAGALREAWARLFGVEAWARSEASTQAFWGV